MFYAYILKTIDDRYYIGSTADLKARLNRHNKGEIRFTKSRLPVTLVYHEEFSAREGAMRRELQLKSWKDRAMLERLIKKAGGPIV